MNRRKGESISFEIGDGDFIDEGLFLSRKDVEGQSPTPNLMDHVVGEDAHPKAFRDELGHALDIHQDGPYFKPHGAKSIVVLEPTVEHGFILFVFDVVEILEVFFEGLFFDIFHIGCGHKRGQVLGT